MCGSEHPRVIRIPNKTAEVMQDIAINLILTAADVTGLSLEAMKPLTGDEMKLITPRSIPCTTTKSILPRFLRILKSLQERTQI